MRWLMIGGAMAIALGGLPLAASAQDASVPEQIVNVMNKLWGSHPALRANHTKGIVAEGSFTPTAGGGRAQHRNPPCSRAGRPRRSRCGSPMRPACPICPTATPTPTRTAWRSSSSLPDGGRGGHRRQLAGVLPGRYRRGVPRPADRQRPSQRPGRGQAHASSRAFVASHPAVPAAVGTVATPVELRHARPTTASTPSCSSTQPASGSRSVSGWSRSVVPSI